MPTTASGIVSLPLQLTQDLICACATFRTEVGAANSTAAAAFVFWDEAFASNARPLALIRDNDRRSQRTSKTGWLTDGVIVVQFDFPMTYTGTSQDNEGAKAFRNKVGAIETEMKAAIIATPSNYIELKQIEGPEIQPPDPDANDGEKFWTAYFALHYQAMG